MDVFASLSFDTIAMVVIATAALRETMVRLRGAHHPQAQQG